MRRCRVRVRALAVLLSLGAGVEASESLYMPPCHALRFVGPHEAVTAYRERMRETFAKEDAATVEILGAGG